MALDDLARFNQARWEELACARVQDSRPALDLDVDRARAPGSWQHVERARAPWVTLWSQRAD